MSNSPWVYGASVREELTKDLNSEAHRKAMEIFALYRRDTQRDVSRTLLFALALIIGKNSNDEDGLSRLVNVFAEDLNLLSKHYYKQMLEGSTGNSLQ